MAKSNDKTEESETKPEADAPDNTKAPVSKAGVLALLLAIVALAGAGWSGWQLNQLGNVPGALDTAANDYQSLAGQLERLQRDQADQQEALKDLEDSLSAGLSSVSDVPLRVQQVEELVKSVPGVEAKQRSDWLRAEALYYLRIANAQAQLTGNAAIAASALQLADEKLLASGDPRLGAVRAKVSDEITALRAVPTIDKEGISFRLQSLAAQTSDWPFRSASPDSFKPAIQAPEGEMSAWDRLLGTLKSVFESIILVKQIEGEPLEQQLGMTERALITENLRSELQIARLAFLANNPELFDQALKQSGAQLLLYFDTDAEAIKVALETIAELRETTFPGAIPDISESLGLFLALEEKQ